MLKNYEKNIVKNTREDYKNLAKIYYKNARTDNE